MSLRNYITITLLLGLVLFSFSLFLPYYTDEVALEKLNTKSYEMEAAEYYKQRFELETDKTYYMDAGMGLMIASVSVWGFQHVGRVRRWRDLLRVKTPSRAAIFIASNLAWALLALAFVWYYYYRFMRGDYPPFAEKIDFTILGTVKFYLLMLIPLNIFLWITTLHAKFHTKLFVIAKHYTLKAVLWELLFAALIFFNLIVAFEFIIDGDHLSIPVSLLFTYILLSLRSGQIARY